MNELYLWSALDSSWMSDYDSEDFAILRMCFLSTSENSHGIPITEEVLRRDASSLLGDLVVAKVHMDKQGNMDFGTHEIDEQIVGYFPKEQSIEFVQENGVLKAYAYAVISKFYAEYVSFIMTDGNRNVSVEMFVERDDATGETLSLNIKGVTLLGSSINGSCPDANAEMVRFDEEKAIEFFSARQKEVIIMDNVDINEVKEQEVVMAEQETECAEVEQDCAEQECDCSCGEKDCAEEADCSCGEENCAEEADCSCGEKDCAEETDCSCGEKDCAEQECDCAEETDCSCGEKDCAEQECDCATEEADCSAELMAKCTALEDKVKEQEDIIMAYEAELAELRAFKTQCQMSEMAEKVDTTMAEIFSAKDRECDEVKALRDEGLECTMETFSAWSNKVKAYAFDHAPKKSKKETGHFFMSTPLFGNRSQSNDLWENLK